MAKVKTIDPFDVKAAVKAGQLGVYLHIDQKKKRTRDAPRRRER